MKLLHWLLVVIVLLGTLSLGGADPGHHRPCRQRCPRGWRYCHSRYSNARCCRRRHRGRWKYHWVRC
ncbi:hypothetical protein FJT64_020240 [Amphibalanus amphitrite]|uniref:Uncharacterized protein n=1 Tax=Amphibalanus amphitrite TaxID=1232801 RepID=A0A6A4WXE4_AMPAM|nr:hypothetical protein FJT64_020240 [Amphibalanus amphitrite]